jgi:hypothetical protein
MLPNLVHIVTYRFSKIKWNISSIRIPGCGTVKWYFQLVCQTKFCMHYLSSSSVLRARPSETIRFNNLKHNNYICTTCFNIKNSAIYSQSLCVSNDSQNKQQLFPKTALLYWFLTKTQCVSRKIGTEFLNIILTNFRFNTLRIVSEGLTLWSFMLVIFCTYICEVLDPKCHHID